MATTRDATDERSDIEKDMNASPEVREAARQRRIQAKAEAERGQQAAKTG